MNKDLSLPFPNKFSNFSKFDEDWETGDHDVVKDKGFEDVYVDTDKFKNMERMLVVKLPHKIYIYCPKEP